MADQLQDAHDSFFRFAISQVEFAKNLIASQLSPEALTQLDLDSLQPLPDSFVDSDLGKCYSDLVFSLKYRIPAGKETSDHLQFADDVLVCILFEHKSYEDPYTAIQLPRYILRIWERRLRDRLPLVPIVPLVVYHGPKRWSAARSLEELISCPEPLRQYQVGFCFPLLDLAETADERLGGDSILKSVLLLLKYSRDAKLIHLLSSIIAAFAIRFKAEQLTQQQLSEWLEAIERYIMSANKHIEPHEYDEAVARMLTHTYEPGSAIDRAVKKGREDGKIIGQIVVLQNLLGLPESTEDELLAKDESELQLLLSSLRSHVKR